MNLKEYIFDSDLHDCQHGGIYSVDSSKSPVQIDFSSNLNPYGISRKVLDRLKNNIAIAYNYPDPKCGDLKKRDSRTYWIGTGF